MSNGFFDRFTVSARRVVAGAQQWARELDNTHIFPTHILLATTTDPAYSSAKVLEASGVRLDWLRVELRRHGDWLPSPVPRASAHISFDHGTRAVLLGAAEEAAARGAEAVDTEHILLALTAHASIAGTALADHGVTHAQVTQQLDLRTAPSGDLAPLTTLADESRHTLRKPKRRP